MKICSRCNEEKPISLFQVRKASKDGLTAACKTCLSEYDKTRANLAHRVESRTLYAKTERGLSAGGRAKRKWKESNKVKRNAANMVSNAVRDKRLIKSKSCSECGKTDCRIHGHHDDYSQPMVVRWLCSLCHRAWHKEHGEAVNG